jgi:hypothetical protein
MRSQALRIIGADAANIVGFQRQLDGTKARHVMHRCHKKAVIAAGSIWVHPLSHKRRIW